MTRKVVDAELKVFEPGNTSTNPADADATIPGSDINSVSIESRLQSAKDTGRITIDNDGGVYTNSVDIGDRVQFRTQLEGENSLSKRWTGLIRPMNHTVRGPTTQDLEIVLEDFVFGIMSLRFVTNRFVSRQTAGTSDSIVNTIVSNNAPEIGTSQIGTISKTLTVNYQRTNLLEAVRRIREQTPVILDSSGKNLVLSERYALSSKFKLNSRDRLDVWSHKETDKAQKNEVVIDGVRETALDIEQTTHDATETVTSTNRRTQQVDVRKGEVAAISIDISPSASSEDFIVRLQSDENGSPKAPLNPESDLARTRLPGDELVDGFNRFNMPENNLPAKNPHIIVETGGSTGHDVRYDSGTGEMAYRVFYYYPIVISASNKSSADRYRLREGRYRRENIVGRDEGNEVALGIIDRRADPGGILSFTADSLRAHNLGTRDVIDVEIPDVGANDQYVVTSVVDSYDGINLNTAITAKTRENV